jgi:hypothetical protein
MYNIAGFLEKFLKFEKDNNTKLSLILETIKRETDLDLTKDKLEINGDSCKLNCNPVFRNEIFMHQSQIESALKSQKIFLKIF